MRQVNFPNWLVWIDKKLWWLSIPKLPLLLTITQALGFFLILAKPHFEERLYFDPNAVLHGEVWRIFTFLAVPITNNFLLIFVLWFFFDVILWLEKTWGSVLLTVYFLFAWFSTILASLLTGIPIDTIIYIECSFFFALATLSPNREIHLFFILPIAFKWIAAFIAVVLLVVPLFLGSYAQQFYMLLIFVNYLIFFGKDYKLMFKRKLDERKKI